jgi:acetyltransferase
MLIDQMIKFTEDGLGFAKAISIGNKAMVGELDILAYLKDDPDTAVIAFYIEGFRRGEGREFVSLAKGCGKPVVMLKSGRTPGGSRAVSSHTASIAGDYENFSAALSQFGVVEASSELEMVSFCKALNAYPEPSGGRVGIVTVSGGHGAVAMDECAMGGLTVPALSGEIQEEIRKGLNPSAKDIASLGNPIDLTGSVVDEDFMVTAKALFTHQEVDCVLALLLPYAPGITSDLGAKLSGLAAQYKKPLVAYVPHMEKYEMLIEGFELNGVPVSHSIEGAVLMVKVLGRDRP